MTKRKPIKLNASFVSSLKAPDASGKQTLYWDSEIKGFGILVSGTTTAKSYVLQRQLAGGTSRRITLGSAYVLTAEEARRQARIKAGEFAAGIDPADTERGRREEARLERERDAVRAITLGDAFERMISGNTSLRPKTITEYRGLVRRYLSDWADTPLLTITPDMLRQRRDRIVSDVESRWSERTVRAEAEGRGDDATRLKELAKTRNGRMSANSVLRLFGIIWNATKVAVRELGDNPVDGIAARKHKALFPERRRETHIKESELRQFHTALMAASQTGYRDAVRLMLFTGMRLAEANELRWDEVNFTEGLIHIPAERIKGKRPLELPMSNYVAELLMGRRKLGLDSPFVFPSSYKKNKPQSDPREVLKYVKEATGVKASNHDLRRTYITVAQTCVLKPYTLPRLLNHSLKGDVTAGYVIIAFDQLREAIEIVETRLTELCGLRSS